MTVLGLVLELNPFHHGHHYFITQAKEKVKPDVTIAVISSSFSMRGEPMVMDKWTKAKTALQFGIDIVLELPFLGAVCSADYFCYNAIATLSAFHITDIAFGVELNDVDKLHEMRKIMQTQAYDTAIKSYLNQGFSFSTSSNKAISHVTDNEDIKIASSLPNNTLAIGYLSALERLQSQANVTLIQRICNQYYDDAITDASINSATSLRKLLVEGASIQTYTPPIDYLYHNPKMANDNMLMLLRYTFLSHPIGYFKQLLGVDEGIEHRIASVIYSVKTYDELIAAIQTKRYTTNRIQRLLLYILLGINLKHHDKNHYYLRLLSMNETGKNYINILPKTIKKQIITTFKNKNHYLVNIELKASKLYSTITQQPNYYLQEYLIPFIGGNNDNE